MQTALLVGWALVSAPVLVFLAVAHALTRLENTRLSRYVRHLEQEHRGESFHRCPYHQDTGLYNAPEHTERTKDLDDIGRRNRDRYQNRTD